MGEQNTVSFLVGTYTEKDSRGIYKYELKGDGSLNFIGLAAESINPSFLAYNVDRQVLLAVNEVDNDNKGGISAFKLTGDSLTFMNSQDTGGAHPCHVIVDDDGYVLASNYTGGSIGLLRIMDDYKLSPLLDVQQHMGKGTTSRQEAPHAHSAWFSPFDTKVIGVDLGTDQLWFSELDTVYNQLTPSDPPTLFMGHGAGPRHLVFHPNDPWIYVVNELNSTISLVKQDKYGDYRLDSSIPTLPEEFKGDNSCADIKITVDGKFLYASNRGHNSIVIFKINEGDGALSLVGHEPTRGDGPRNFSLSPDGHYLLVANQNTDNIVSFRRNTETGQLSFVDEIKAPTPVCILF